MELEKLRSWQIVLQVGSEEGPFAMRYCPLPHGLQFGLVSACHLSGVRLYMSGVICHWSGFTCQVSYITCLVSCVMCYVSCAMYNVSCVMCHVLCVMCHVSHVTCHMSLTPTATATDPPPAPPILAQEHINRN